MNIKYEIKDRVLYVQLARPEKRNAFHPEMMDEIIDVFTKETKEVCAVHLSGEGSTFSGGGDLSWMKSMVDFSFEENKKEALKLYSMFEAISNCLCPIVTVVHGHAMGGALGILGLSDVVVAEENTKFAFTEVQLGLAPAVINPFVVGKVSQGFIREWFLTGRVFSAKEAQASGLVQKVFPTKEEALKSAEETLSYFRRADKEALIETKKLMQKVSASFSDNSFLYSQTKDKIKEECVHVISSLRVSDEAQKRLRKFLEKK